MKTKVHMVILLVVDHDQLGAKEIGAVLEDAHYPNHCIGPSVMHIETREVDWDVDHPLNKTAKQAAAFKELFLQPVESSE